MSPQAIRITRLIFDDQDYEQGALLARTLLVSSELSDSQRPFVVFLKLFAEGYRSWQISYHYTEIRNYFQLAWRHLQKTEQSAAQTQPESRLRLAIGAMTEMLCAYTRCENAAINNDPIDLQARSAQAVRCGKEALRHLKERAALNDPFLRALADELREYLVTNRLLHKGLFWCARAYAPVFLEGTVSPSARRDLRSAQRALRLLQPRSLELGSELDAHVRIVDGHVKRLDKGNGRAATRLSVRRGFLGMSMTVACEPADVQELLPRLDTFKRAIRTKLAVLGLSLEGLGQGRLHDIFETTLGAKRMGEIVFKVVPDEARRKEDASICDKDADDCPVRVRAFGGRTYPFTIRAALSSFGTCSVRCEHEIDYEQPLLVEEIRAIQSLVCPHAGQAEILLPQGVLAPHDAREWLLSRIDVCALESGLGEMVDKAGAAADVTGRIDKIADWISCTHVDEARLNPSEEMGELAVAAVTHKPGCLGAYDYLWALLADIAGGIAETVGELSLGERKNNGDLAKRWRRRVPEDTAWHVSLCATDIGIGSKGPKLTFQQLKFHDDFQGLLVEQREARSSFDDWRFVPRVNLTAQGGNLAGIRSHETDVLSVSEYQAFMYFPDDPKYLVDQYVATVDVMNRLRTRLRSLERDTAALSDDVEKDLRASDARKDLPPVEDPERKLREIEVLVWEVNDFQALVTKTSLSRYKDHGELLVRMGRAVGLQDSLDLLLQRVSALMLLRNQIFAKLAKKQESLDAMRTKRRDRIIAMLGLLLGVNAVESLANMFWRWLAWLRQMVPDQNLFALGAVGVFWVILFLFWLILREPRAARQHHS